MNNIICVSFANLISTKKKLFLGDHDLNRSDVSCSVKLRALDSILIHKLTMGHNLQQKPDCII